MKTIFFFWDVEILFFIAAFPNMVCSKKNSGHSYQLTYSELQDLNVSCFPLDSCKERDKTVGHSYTCDCDRSCAEFGQCCIDSEFMTSGRFEGSRNAMKCLPVYGKDNFAQQDVFMIDSCKDTDAGGDHLCRSNGEDTNDPFLMIPVTSTASEITYKNYFCLVCNEDLDVEHILFWNLIVFDRKELNDTLPELMYDTSGYWMVVEGYMLRRVAIGFQIPSALHSMVRHCKAYLRSECAGNWTDDSTRYKCKAYLAAVRVERKGIEVWYRNPHCAICNFEAVDTLSCTEGVIVVDPDIQPLSRVALVNLFLLDKKERCGRSMVYDGFAKKCRCNSRKHVMRDGKCIERL